MMIAVRFIRWAPGCGGRGGATRGVAEIEAEGGII